MASPRNVLRNCTINVDGRGYAGQVEELMLPVLEATVEDFRGGGMDGPIGIQMGMEKLTSSFSLISFDRDVLALFGMVEGSTIPLTVRGHLQSFNNDTQRSVARLRGQIRKMDPGTWKPGQKPTLSIELDLVRYSLTVGGETVHDIDVENSIRIVNGFDQLEEMRNSLGI